MTDMEATIMQAKEAYQTARAYARRGEMVKAAKVLRGVDHPKCEALLDKIKSTPEYRRWQNRQRFFIGLVATVMLLLVVSWAYMHFIGDPQALERLCATEAVSNYTLSVCH